MISSQQMKFEETIRKRDALVLAIGNFSEILRGSLLERTIRHKYGCQTCVDGKGHPALILSTNYPGGLNKQISLRLEQKLEVERWLNNYHDIKDKLEAICELNRLIIRPDRGR
jgi:hypothetical protein